LPCHQSVIMDTMNISAFPLCPRKPQTFSLGCGTPFLAQYNRLVLLHRLTACKFRNPPIPVYRYPDTLYWTMGHITPEFCIRNARLSWHTQRNCY
jgi:hypothetical protein